MNMKPMHACMLPEILLHNLDTILMSPIARKLNLTSCSSVLSSKAFLNLPGKDKILLRFLIPGQDTRGHSLQSLFNVLIIVVKGTIIP